jgi:hypothetical protein
MLASDIMSPETIRVHRHLLGAEEGARRRDTRSLGPARNLVRQLLLSELARYRSALRYPRNRDFPGKVVPYFVDEDGTRCAMAHLLEVGGQRELVRKIARERNHALVRELADDPTLAAWLSAAGLSVAEAARIQPSYCSQPAIECFCSADVLPQAIAEGTVLRAGTAIEDSVVTDLVRVDIVKGPTTGVQPGDTPEINTLISVGVGETVLLSLRSASSYPPGVFPDAGRYGVVGIFGPIRNGTVTCSLDAFSQSHPVPIGALEAALLAGDTNSCEAKLAAVDPRWTPSCSGCGCETAAMGRGSSAPAVATAAILAAILCYRRRRVSSSSLARAGLVGPHST